MSRQQVPSTRWTEVRCWLLAALACVYVLLLFPPWQFARPGVGLDPSWTEVIGYGTRHAWQWGHDITFTYGPLGFLMPNPYEEGLLGIALGANTFLALAFAQGLVAILPRESLSSSIGLFMLIAFPAAMIGRLVYTAFGLLAALIYFRRPTDAGNWRPLMLAAAAGLFAMVYVSSAVVSLGIFLLLDLSRVTYRRWPVFLPVFAAASAFSYLAAGQEATHLFQFLRGSIELIAGYSIAMSIVGNRLELLAFPALSVVGLANVLWSERARLRSAGERRDALWLLAAVGLHWFVTFKSGFVRHDLHSVIAWQMLAIMGAAYAAMRWRNPGSQHVRWLLVVLSITASIVSIFAWEQGVQLAPVGRYANGFLIRAPVGALKEAAEAVTNSSEWRRAVINRRAQALSEIRDAVPLPSVDGSVDVIPAVQSAVFAHGLPYRPRPVFQDYAAYTSWLINLNRAHYRSAGAADYMFFTPSTIDNRYPLLDQSTTISELLTFYDPWAFERDLLVLKRRAEPLRAVQANSKESTAALGQWVSMEAVNAPVMLSVAFSSNLLGRLATFLFRPPILTVTVRLANGDERRFRLIENIARSGFLLSPLAETSSVFAAAATDMWEAVEGMRVVAFRIDTLSASRRRFYGQPFKYASAELRLDPSAARARGVGVRTWLQRQEVTRTK